MKIKLITIRVKDMDESLGFYQEVLGLKEVRRIEQMENMLIVFLQDKDGAIIELIENSGENNGDSHMSDGRVSVGFGVENMDETLVKLATYSIEVSQGPITTPGGEIIAFIKDPNGVEIEFIQGFGL